MSAYANLEDRIVVKGQSVDADQAIGKMAGGQLYFALRLGKNLINPLTYLPKK